ncbi:hypothetical protein GOODEAATRI_024953 [Goodea atripinnis]|uniref:C2H2-type domain-containing protein n=1 Tax=Goodea atripinnis TaxID=208336 RepID=A0ABV0PS51_9TELE
MRILLVFTYCHLVEKMYPYSFTNLQFYDFCTKHKTILEARSGLGPIKAYPRLGPKPSGEQGGGPVDPNTQERTFHCEICNVRVNSELQLKQGCCPTRWPLPQLWPQLLPRTRWLSARLPPALTRIPTTSCKARLSAMPS